MSGASDHPEPPPPERPAAEMPRPVPVGRIGAGLHMRVEMRPGEAKAVAARMGLEAVHSLVCDFDLRRCEAGGEAGAITASGRLRARVRQGCVVTLDPFDAEITEDFAVRFVPLGTEADDLDLEAEDEIAYQGGTIDLGEAACEQLALALDPFPRKPGAELPDADGPQAGGAFAALSKLLPPH